jgi:hypothetical protein
MSGSGLAEQESKPPAQPSDWVDEVKETLKVFRVSRRSQIGSPFSCRRKRNDYSFDFAFSTVHEK